MSERVILKNDISQIGKLTETVLKFGRDNRLSDDFINDIRLVLEELVTNIISYAFEDKKEHLITLKMAIKPDDIFVAELRDDGKCFDPTKYCNPDVEKPFDERDIGGMGIHLVHQLMDELEYRRERGENIVLKKKYIR